MANKRSGSVPGASNNGKKAAKKPARKFAAPTADTGLSENIESEIRQRAYELYEESGRQDGLAEQQWLQAEREVLSRRGRTA